MGAGALSACGVTDLGPETADPDARSPSRSGGAAAMCVLSWWSRPRLQAGGCAHRPRESALPWAGVPAPPLMWGVTSPPPFPRSFPSHRRRPFLTEEDAYFCGTLSRGGRAGGEGFARPLSCDSSRHWLVGWDYDGDPGPLRGPRHKGGLNSGPFTNAQ